MTKYCPTAMWAAGCFLPGPGLSGTALMNPAAANDPGLNGAVSAAFGMPSNPTANNRFIWSHEVGGHARHHSMGMSCSETCAQQLAPLITSMIP